MSVLLDPSGLEEVPSHVSYGTPCFGPLRQLAEEPPMAVSTVVKFLLNRGVQWRTTNAPSWSQTTERNRFRVLKVVSLRGKTRLFIQAGGFHNSANGMLTCFCLRIGHWEVTRGFICKLTPQT